MELKTAEGLSITNVTEEELINMIQDDARRGEFVILIRREQEFIQAGGFPRFRRRFFSRRRWLDEGDRIVMEYQEGGTDHHFQCTQEISKVEVQATFLKYLKGDPSWKNDFQWKKIDVS